jgi:hypothetical protein
MGRKKKLKSRTKAAKLRSSGAKPPPVSEDTGSDLPPIKRRKTGEVVMTVTTDSAEPPRLTEFDIRKRAGLGEMTKVKLLPRLLAKAGTLIGISFGRNRTPSPFGNRMGDHTGSWTSVVDSVHARLYGKDLSAAVAELTTMQQDAQAWMSDDASVGMALWKRLDPADQDRRRAALENYAFTVGGVDGLLDQARALLLAKGPDEKVAELLAEATAHHLAFLNFLPFATVPAKGDPGSRGSGEGAARAKVLDVELDVEDALQWDEYLRQEKDKDKEKRLAAEQAAKLEKTKGETPEETSRREADERAEAAAAKEQQLTNARDGLWGLFSMEAAVRAADVERAVAPAKIAEHLELLRQLQTLSTKVRLLLPAFILPPTEVNPATGRKRPRTSAPPDLGLGRKTFAADIAALQRTAAELKKATDDLPYQQEIQPLVTELNDTVNTMASLHGNVFASDSNIFEAHLQNIGDFTANLDKRVSWLSADPATVRAETALLLAHLVHEHQTTVARAYPNAVEQTKFLGDKPDEDAKRRAAAQVLSYITDKVKGVEGVEEDAARLLEAKMIELYPRLGATPTPGPKSRWVADSRTASLVASFKGETLSVQGRPAAPPGVGGMGSHTTAWVTEVGWVRKRLAEAGMDGIAATLKAAATKELNGHLMTKLAQHLPADQLAAGQLDMIFDAALDVMAATEPADAITAYLSFRNLLPYATVDAGDRGGHAERVGAAKATVFDGESLRAAIEQKLLELDKDRLDDTIKALRAAADSLAKDYAALAEPEPEPEDVDMTDSAAEPPPLTWKSVPDVGNAIDATVKALRDEVTRLEQAAKESTDPAAGVEATIYETRETEHNLVYASANS